MINRFSRLIRMCAWHKPAPLLLGVSEPTMPGMTGTTDGMCPDCMRNFLNLNCPEGQKESSNHDKEN